MQQAACNKQHATSSMQQAACNKQHATYNALAAGTLRRFRTGCENASLGGDAGSSASARVRIAGLRTSSSIAVGIAVG
jgi:hypothetical protein